MQIIAVKTRVLQPPQDNLLQAIKESILRLEERSILVVTSKAVSIWQGRCLRKDKIKDKDTLIYKEADKFLPREKSPGGMVILTMKNNILIPSAGVDESNASGHYILWPKTPQEAAKKLWIFLQKTYNLKHCGVIITDSHSVPCKKGLVGVAVAYFGFKPFKDYRGLPDLFGRKLRMTFVNIVDSLAAGAVLLMGEGDEQTPLAIITDVPFIEFFDLQRIPSSRSLSIKINPKQDLFRPILESVPWQQKIKKPKKAEI